MELSVADRRITAVGGTPNPWARLGRDWPNVEVRYVDLGEQSELVRWEQPHPVIYLHYELLQVQRRFAIAHALEHLDRGLPCEWLRASTEAKVIRATAAYLLPDLDLIRRALATCSDARAAASELWVPYRALVDRLNGLSDAESLYVHGIREVVA